MKSLIVPAEEEKLNEIMDFVMETIEGHEPDDETSMQLELAIEEIFVNIVSYAYSPKTGDVEICAEMTEDPPELVITFADSGVPFNPLEKEEADTSPEALEEREGGLGIYMIRQLMDEVAYIHEDGKNILRIRKRLT